MINTLFIWVPYCTAIHSVSKRAAGQSDTHRYFRLAGSGVPLGVFPSHERPVNHLIHVVVLHQAVELLVLLVVCPVGYVVSGVAVKVRLPGTPHQCYLSAVRKVVQIVSGVSIVPTSDEPRGFVSVTYVILPYQLR